MDKFGVKGANSMKRKMLSLLLCLIFALTITGTVFATDTTPSSSINLANGVILGTTANSIKETGENLVEPQNRISTTSALADNDVIITVAFVQNEGIHITGNANGIPFDAVGTFCSISDNGNVIAFDTIDQTNNFRVVYCAVEKELDKAALYFESFAANSLEFNVVTKLYLAPNSDEDGQYIMAELYGNSFPTISEEAISELPENHQLNLFWYAKEFKPVATDERAIAPRSGNPTYTMLESYTFQNLGMTYRHYLRYRERCDIRDVTRNQSSTASATLEVTQKWVDAELENDCSSTYSTLSLKNISIGYFTMPNTAVQSMMSTGEVTRYGSIKLDYTFKIGVNLNGLSIPTTVYVSWTPGSTNYATGVYHKVHTNSGGDYWRGAVAEIASSNSLSTIGNYVQAFWNYASYSSRTSTGTASLVFSFGVDNELDYTQYKPVEHVRDISVSVT